MLTLKILNAAPPSGDSLCYSCGNAVVIRGFRDAEVLVFCERFYPDQKIPFLVRECSTYTDRMLPSKHDMEEIAWPVGDRKIDRHPGFVQPSRPLEGDRETE